MSFDAAAIGDLFAQLTSPCRQLGAFKSVIAHEPTAAPTSLPALALWWASVAPARGASGLGATSARVEFKGRAYLSALTRPEDDTEQKLLALSSLVLGTAYTAGFTLAGEAMLVDLLGAYGAPLGATAGYVDHDDHPFRVAELVIPVVVDGIWVQGA